MKPRYKVTGCARFFVFAIIFVPIVFFGATYIRGENGVQIIKDPQAFRSGLRVTESPKPVVQWGDLPVAKF